jgi:hypothetical protein
MRLEKKAKKTPKSGLDLAAALRGKQTAYVFLLHEHATTPHDN